MLRIENVVCDAKGLHAAGRAVTTAAAELLPVRVDFGHEGEQVSGVRVLVDLGGAGGAGGLVLVDGTPNSDGLPPGAWLVTGDQVLPLATPPRRATESPSDTAPDTTTDPARRDALGRPLPPRRHRTPDERRRKPRALVTSHGIVVPRAAAVRRKGVTTLDSPMVRGWSPPEPPPGANGISINLERRTFRLVGALTALPATPPYKTTIAGLLIVGAGPFTGTAMGAYVVPDGGTDPSMFVYAALTGDPLIGAPPFELNGVSAGFGWNSKVRVPAAEALASFPFLKALDDPGSIGHDEEATDPLDVLATLVGGGSLAWVQPSEGNVWIAAGFAFGIFELIKGRAMAIGQFGDDLAISLLGAGGAELPTKSAKKIARVEIGIEATIRPASGELSLGVGLTENTFVIDPDCKVRGGVGLKVWFGANPNAGDFAFILGRIPAGREVPARYPKGAEAALTWALGSTVTISGSAYAGLTPKSLMAGGALELVFQSGMLRAWLIAKVDAFLQWKPFYFDVGMSVRVGVSATVKIWFVRIRISIEVGVSVRVWGPPVGGEATVHLWFISFTIGFGKPRDNTPPPLDWGGFQGTLPAPQHMVRSTAGPGLIGEGPAPATRSGRKPWIVDNAGFRFTADTQVPVTKVYLGKTGTVDVAGGGPIDILPMGLRDRQSELRVWITFNGDDAYDLMRWGRKILRGPVPRARWGDSAAGGELIPDRVIGIDLASPPVDHGTDTGFIDEKGISFDQVSPAGIQPLDPAAAPVGPVPQRPSRSVVEAIVTGVNSDPVKARRSALLDAVETLGLLDRGPVDTDLAAYKSAAGTAFTADPMLIPA
ncbi:hypothetical protein B4N89_37315 [Embleya scabrispora]|uniref:DUF6603 domain-containing protein n=1 Tax=Embleya scabrispora TaxID=159449 RepID=A0A1T3NMM6_9ACTN|nr:DUF6603 domain-containing protein [Embleya scabrispora]OPC77911.1 hypothetical protein B4N89_37315 [Embleya scabrispora]